jgi:hypothetical protein
MQGALLIISGGEGLSIACSKRVVIWLVGIFRKLAMASLEAQMFATTGISDSLTLKQTGLGSIALMNAAASRFVDRGLLASSNL